MKRGYESETLTITATVSPDNSADNTGLDWSMAFKNPSSEWAAGKTLSDYMTLTPSGTDVAGSKTVSVKCLKPFGEQIVITATSQDNPAVSGKLYGGLRAAYREHNAQIRGSQREPRRGYEREVGAEPERYRRRRRDKRDEQQVGRLYARGGFHLYRNAYEQ